MKDQNYVSNQRGLPVEERNTTSVLNTISGLTVQFYYSNAGVRTIDAGQAAGTLVEGVIGYRNIQDLDGIKLGHGGSTSFTFTSTAMTQIKDIPVARLEEIDLSSMSARLTFIGQFLTSNGDYAIDHSKGVVYCRKATTAVSATSCSIKVVQQGSTGTSFTSVPSAAPSTLSETAVVTQYNASPATSIEGQVRGLQGDQYGNLKTSDAYLPYGSDPVLSRQGVMEKRDNLVRTTTAITQAVKASPAADILVVVNAALTGTLSLYNHPSTATNLIAVLPAALPAGVYRIGVNCSLGLTYVTSAADAVTVAVN